MNRRIFLQNTGLLLLPISNITKITNWLTPNTNKQQWYNMEEIQPDIDQHFLWTTQYILKNDLDQTTFISFSAGKIITPLTNNNKEISYHCYMTGSNKHLKYYQDCPYVKQLNICSWTKNIINAMSQISLTCITVTDIISKDETLTFHSNMWTPIINNQLPKYLIPNGE